MTPEVWWKKCKLGPIGPLGRWNIQLPLRSRTCVPTLRLFFYHPSNLESRFIWVVLGRERESPKAESKLADSNPYGISTLYIIIDTPPAINMPLTQIVNMIVVIALPFVFLVGQHQHRVRLNTTNPSQTNQSHKHINPNPDWHKHQQT